MIICAGCGQEQIIKNRARGRAPMFCSNECRKTGKVVHWECEGCGKACERYLPPSDRTPKWCSLECRLKYRALAVGAKEVTFTCAACGETKTRRWRRGESLPSFCSKECHRAATPPGVGNKKREWTAVMDAVIRDVWRTHNRGQRMPVIQRDPLFRDVPLGALYHRVQALGLSERDVHLPWTPQEDEVLEKFAGDLCVQQIAQRLRKLGYKRTFGAVAKRIFAKYERGQAGQTYTTTDVARLFGWSRHVVQDWIRDGKLHAVRQGTYYRVHPSEIASFVRREGEILGRRAVDVVTLVKIIDEHPQTMRTRKGKRDESADE